MHSSEDAEDVFHRFVSQRRKDLQRIASHSRGDCELADVINEAWLLARELVAPAELLDHDAQQLLLSHLYQRLVRYTEQHLRRAVRLDHAPAGSPEDDCHPLMALLAADSSHEPLAQLVERETRSQQESELGASPSLAGAYVRLLRLFDNRMQAVAEHLLISTSYAYRRCAQARLLAAQQHPVPEVLLDGRFVPGPWRRFRLHRTPVQLAFDFEDELPLEQPAQVVFALSVLIASPDRGSQV